MATINFTLKSNANPAAIYIRLKDGRKTDIMAKTNLFIDPAQWNASKQRPKSLGDEVYKSINKKLLELYATVLSKYNEENSKEIINTAWLKNVISPNEKQGLTTRLVDYIDVYHKENKALTPGSLIRHNVVKHKLERYEKYIKSKIYIIGINKAFQENFTKYSIDNNYAPNTIARDMRFIKTFCRHAKANGIETHPQLDVITGKYEDVETVYLNFNELLLIKDVKLTESMDNVRDWLLISCYTGQRISDFLRFDKSMIRKQENQNKETVLLIEFRQKKTGKIMTLPLHKEVIAILDKRNGDFPPAISDPKYNEYIKIVCEKAGIKEMVSGSRNLEQKKGSGVYRKQTGIYPKYELVTSHIGRRSFATNFYGKIPTSLLIAATGHSTEQMFLKYIGKSASDRAMELANWF